MNFQSFHYNISFFIKLPVDNGREEGCELGDDTQDDDGNELGNDDGVDVFERLFQLDPAGCARNKQCRTDRRRDGAHGVADADDNAEGQRIEADRRGDRVQQRHEHDNERSAVNEHAANEEDDGDDHHDDERALRERRDGVREHAGDVRVGEDPAPHRGGADDKHDRAGGAGGVAEDSGDILESDRFRHHKRDEQSVHYGDDRSLGGREHTSEDAADDDDGDEQRPDCFLRGLAEELETEAHRVGFTEALAAADEEADDADAETDDAAGDDSRDEQLAHLQVRDTAKHDHAQARWDDDTKRTGGGLQWRGEVSRIALPLHRGD